MLKRLLGVTLILLSVYFWFFGGKIKIRPTKTNALIAGGLAGAMSGLFAMGGPPMVVYYVNSLENKEDYMATIQCFFALSGVISTINRVQSGFITSTALLLFIPAFAITFLATFLGKKIYGKIRPELLKKVVYVFMAISGLVSLING